MVDNSHLLPGWLEALLTEEFFAGCNAHEDVRKNEKNIFCLDCCVAICPHCLTPHRSHSLLQVRRYIYHDVLRLKDAERLLNCASVQSYISNGEKVVFLNQRPTTKPYRGSAKLCIFCDRAVQESFLFCSIYCKLQHMMNTGVKLSDHIYNWDSLVLPEPRFGDDLMTPETVLEPTASVSGGSASSASGDACVAGGIILDSNATTEIVEKKGSTLSVSATVQPNSVPEVLPAAVKNRRKNRPHRSPLQ